MTINMMGFMAGFFGVWALLAILAENLVDSCSDHRLTVAKEYSLLLSIV